MRRFKKGDRLIAIEPNLYLTKGKVYTAISDQSFDDLVEVVDDLKMMRFLRVTRFKKETKTMTTSTTTAKINDIVLVRGTIKKGPDSSGDFTIEFEGKATPQFVPGFAIEKIVGTAPKFKVGDTVQMNPLTGNVDTRKKGKIEYINPTDNKAYVSWVYYSRTSYQTSRNGTALPSTVTSLKSLVTFRP